MAARREKMRAKFVNVNGSASQKLSMATAQQLGAEIGQCSVTRFPDTEVNVQLNEPVRERRVFIVQSSCPPVDQHVMKYWPSRTPAVARRPRGLPGWRRISARPAAISDGAGELP